MKLKIYETFNYETYVQHFVTNGSQVLQKNRVTRLGI
jgi:hypothetical protein